MLASFVDLGVLCACESCEACDARGVGYCTACVNVATGVCCEVSCCVVRRCVFSMRANCSCAN